jgi:hypothetical protein
MTRTLKPSMTAVVLLAAAASAAQAQTTATIYHGGVNAQIDQTLVLTARAADGDTFGPLQLKQYRQNALDEIAKTNFEDSIVIAATGGPGMRIADVHLDSGTKQVQLLIQETPKTKDTWGTAVHVIRVTRTVFLSSLTARWGRKDGFEGWTVTSKRETLGAVALTGKLIDSGEYLQTLDGAYRLPSVRGLPMLFPILSTIARDMRGSRPGVLAKVHGLYSRSRKEIIEVKRIDLPGYTLRRTRLSGVLDGSGAVAPFREMVSVRSIPRIWNTAGKRVTLTGWYRNSAEHGPGPTFLVEDRLSLEGHDDATHYIGDYDRGNEGFPASGTLRTFGDPSKGPLFRARPKRNTARGLVDVLGGGGGSGGRRPRPVAHTQNGNVPVYLIDVEGEQVHKVGSPSPDAPTHDMKRHGYMQTVSVIGDRGPTYGELVGFTEKGGVAVFAVRGFNTRVLKVGSATLDAPTHDRAIHGFIYVD